MVVLAAGALRAGVRGSPHDFSGRSWSGGQICLPCHGNHGSSGSGYSWNHAFPADTAFTTRADAALGESSLMCLGCHDGQTALDSFGGATGSTVMTGGAVVGRDLRDDHPVGVAYPSGDPRYRSAGVVEGNLPLYDGRLECGSCHDPHDNRWGKFLRLDSRVLCQTCHDL